MPRVSANSIDIEYEEFGDPEAEPALLIMGLGMQMIAWDDDFCAQLAERGFRVIRFDNRDAGLSTHMVDAPEPNLFAAMTGDHASATYTLDDMADDTAALLDALGIGSAHIIGASMGGMIAQTLAIRHPERVRSLTSIMSTTGSPAVGQPTPDAMAALLAPPPPPQRDAVIARAVETFRTIGSPGELFDEPSVRRRAERAFDRDHDPVAMGRQLVAILASGDRTDRLRTLDMPAVAVHGDKDPLVGPDGGAATAEAIPGATLVSIPGMGHDLPRPLWPLVFDAIEQVSRAAATR
jgi:pimeloyl-ACP methyl ester carboxylesterase